MSTPDMSSMTLHDKRQRVNGHIQYRHGVGQDNLLKFKPSIGMAKKCYLSDFECGMVQGGLIGMKIGKMLLGLMSHDFCDI